MATVKDLSGYDEGDILPNNEMIVGDYDEDSNVIGWHKETV